MILEGGISYLAHSVFDDTAHVTDGDEDTRRVQKPNVLAPRDFRGCGSRARIQSAVPDARDNDEEAEDEDLKDQATENNVLAQFEAVFVFGLDEHARTATLDTETEDVATDKDLGCPVGSDD